MPSAYGGQSQQRWGDNTLNADEYKSTASGSATPTSVPSATIGVPASRRAARYAGTGRRYL